MLVFMELPCERINSNDADDPEAVRDTRSAVEGAVEAVPLEEDFQQVG